MKNKKSLYKKRETVHTEYFQDTRPVSPNKIGKLRIPSTSRRKTDKFHFRTGSLHKNKISKNRESLQLLSQKEKQSLKNVKFDFGKIMNRNLKTNSRRSNPINLIKKTGKTICIKLYSNIKKRLLEKLICNSLNE